jgi:tripartite-type tricarboxylate transporter receptor subunit TctC
MKTHTLLSFVALSALALGPVAASAATCPAGFPGAPIQMLVGYGAGGGTDAIARAIAADMEKRQGWTVVVDNRPGAGGGVMSAMLKGMAPDGLNVGVAATGTVALNPYETPDSPFTYEDFHYIGTAMNINYGLVTITEKPFKTLDEFIAYAKEKGSATIATGGKSQEILVQQMADHWGVNLIAVPGKGASDSMQAALGGHVDATTQGTQHVQQINAGKMVQLASLTDARVPYAPDSPTLIEAGLDATIDGQTIFMLPKGATPEIKTCLEQALSEAVNSDGYAVLMDKLENAPQNLGPQGTLRVISKAAAFYKSVLGAK